MTFISPVKVEISYFQAKTSQEEMQASKNARFIGSSEKLMCKVEVFLEEKSNFTALMTMSNESRKISIK